MSRHDGIKKEWLKWKEKNKTPLAKAILHDKKNKMPGEKKQEKKHRPVHSNKNIFSPLPTPVHANNDMIATVIFVTL